MVATLQSSRQKFQPATYVRDSAGIMQVFDGLDRPRRWDGKTSAIELSGIDEPTVAPTVAQGIAGAIEAGTFQCYYRYIDRDGYPGNLSPVGSVTISASRKIDWSTIGNPSSNTRITHVELYRTGASGSNLLYLLTTLTVGTTTYTDNIPNATLVTGTQLVILTGDGRVNAERFDLPPDWRPYVFSHQGRLFGVGVVDYNEGHLVLTNGSATVTGVGTNFTQGMVGRFVYITGATAPVEVLSVASATSLTLTANYGGSSDSFAEYSIRPAPAYRNSADYSGALEPEAWDGENNIAVPERNDEVTGGFSLGGFPFLVTPRNLYRVGYYSDPAPPPDGDGRVHNTGQLRGAEHHRLIVEAAGHVYMLDRQGIHRFDGATTEPISEPIEDIFRRGLAWDHSKYWHAAHHPEISTVKFYCLGGTRYARNALCFNYRTTQWVLELWTLGLGCSVPATLGGRKRVLAGAEHARVLLLDEGNLDGTKAAGTTCGYPTSAGLLSLTDASAVHPADIVGAPLAIVRGRGKGQVRTIVASSSGLLTIDSPWLVIPDFDKYSDTRSVYQIGGFPWKVKLGTYRFADKETSNPRDVQLEFQPSKLPDPRAPQVDLRVYLNHNEEADLCGVTIRAGEGSQEPYLGTVQGEPDVMLRMNNPEGYIAAGNAGGRDDAGASNRWQTIELRGHANADRLRLFALEALGVTTQG